MTTHIEVMQRLMNESFFLFSARFQKTEREEDAVVDRETKPVKSRNLSSKTTKTKEVTKSSSEDNDGDNDGEDVITMGK